MQNYLVFETTFKRFKTSRSKSNQIIAWKSNELPEESIRLSTKWNNSLAQKMNFLMVPRVKQNLMEAVSIKVKTNFCHRSILNVYFSYEINFWLNDLDSTFPLWNFFFGALKLTKNIDLNNY